MDVFDIKGDVIKTLKELGINEEDLYVSNTNHNYYHPGRSGSINLKTNKGPVLALFGEIHPLIVTKLDFKEKNIYGFEIFLDNIPQPNKKLRINKDNFEFSDYQRSERDFAFIINKDYQVGKLKNIIKKIDTLNIKSVDIFDIFESENLPEGKKSVAINVVLQSDNKTLSEKDINQISEKIIQEIQEETGGTIRS